MRRFPLPAVVLFWMGLACPAYAQSVPCAGEPMAHLWEQGYAAFQAADYERAQTVLRPLANEGLAPAQWMVGRMVAQGWGTPADAEAGLVWLRLARKADFFLARQDIRAAEDKVPPTRGMAVDAILDRWKPDLTVTCATETALPVKFSADAQAAPQKDVLYDRWVGLARSAHLRNPLVGPYLLSVDRVHFTVETTAHAAVARTDAGIVLQISTAVFSQPEDRAIELILSAAREWLNQRMLERVMPAPNETYRGVMIRGAAGVDNTSFFAMMRQALDFVPLLPAVQRKQVDAIREVRYAPKFRYAVPATANTAISSYVTDKAAAGGGYTLFRLDPVGISAVEALGALMATALVKASPQMSATEVNCQVSRTLLGLQKPLGLDGKPQEREVRRMNQGNCGGA